MSALRIPALLLLAAVLLTQSYIDLELQTTLLGWSANAPVADLAALCLIPLAALSWLSRRPHPLPGAAGYLLLLLAGGLSLNNAIRPEVGLHFLIRKPLFLYVAYAFGVVWAVRALPRRWVLWLLLGWAGSTAGLSVVTSVLRVVGGDALWFSKLTGLTPNHKTLAVSLAGGLPLLVAAAGLPGRRFVVGLSVLAIFASASKTAWLMLLLGAGLFWPRQRPLAHCWQIVPVIALGVALAYYAPLLLQSRAMLDAARSRHSLNRRAIEMFTANPICGGGVGMNVHIEQVTFPDYRVNGVDAHGVIQKVGSETGLLGLVGYGWFSLATLWGLRKRWEADGGTVEGLPYGAIATWGVSTAGLFLSTETFSQTWWAPVSVAWGLAHHPTLMVSRASEPAGTADP